MNDAKAVNVVHAFGYLLCSPQQGSLQQYKGIQLSMDEQLILHADIHMCYVELHILGTVSREKLGWERSCCNVAVKQAMMSAQQNTRQAAQHSIAWADTA